MKIIKHGHLLYFVCPECGCEWEASKDECRLETTRIDNVPCGMGFVYDCPDCEHTAIGTNKHLYSKQGG